MMHNMVANFGLSLSTRAVLFDWGTLPDLIKAAKTAEKSGYFHGVWVGDNLLSKPRVEAIVTLSAIAAHTQRVRLGTICLASFPTAVPLPSTRRVPFCRATTEGSSSVIPCPWIATRVFAVPKSIARSGQSH